VVDTGDCNKIAELIEEFSFKGVPSIEFDFKLLSSIISDDNYLAMYKKLNKRNQVNVRGNNEF